jgi:hypothetical protein
MIYRSIYILIALLSLSVPAAGTTSTFDQLIQNIAQRASDNRLGLALAGMSTAVYVYSQGWYTSPTTPDAAIIPIKLNTLWNRYPADRLNQAANIILQQSTIPQDLQTVLIASDSVTSTDFYYYVLDRLAGIIDIHNPPDAIRSFTWWPSHLRPPASSVSEQLDRLQKLSRIDTLDALLRHVAHMALRVCHPEDTTHIQLAQMVQNNKNNILVSGDVMSDIRNNYTLRRAQIYLLVIQLWGEVTQLIDHLDITNWQRSRLQQDAYQLFTHYMIFVTIFFNIAQEQTSGGQWSIPVASQRTWWPFSQPPRGTAGILLNQADVIRASTQALCKDLQKYEPLAIMPTSKITQPSLWPAWLNISPLLYALYIGRRNINYLPGIRSNTTRWMKQVEHDADQIYHSSPSSLPNS